MKAIQIVAFDLDGTLLDSDKNISERNIRALARCAEKGIYVVPTTGRPTDGVPKRIRELPGVRYAITTTGGAIVDLETGEQLMACTLSPQKAVELLEITREFDVMADPYIGGRAVTEERCMAQLHHYGLSEAMQTMVHDTRDVVRDVVEYVRQSGKGVEKINIFFADIADRAPLRCRLEQESGIAITAAMVNNLELNDENATKGNGLMWLADYLGVDREATMAVGDGENDVSMIRMAGVGVAMDNALDLVKQYADEITLTNDEDGVAAVIERLIG